MVTKMIDSKKLLDDLQKKAISLAENLRKLCHAEPEVDASLEPDWEAVKAKKLTSLTYKAWRDGELAQVAVTWVLRYLLVGFLDENELVEEPMPVSSAARL